MGNNHFLHGKLVSHQKKSGFYRSLKRWSRLTANPKWSIFPNHGETKKEFISRTTSLEFMGKFHPKYTSAKLAGLAKVREKNLTINILRETFK